MGTIQQAKICWIIIHLYISQVKDSQVDSETHEQSLREWNDFH